MMRIEQWDPADEKTLLACYDVMLAAHKADEPIEPPLPLGLFGRYLKEGWENTPGESWVAFDDGGAVYGYYRLRLPDLENLDKARGGPVVHPALRRRGIGRALLRHEADRAAANGRTTLGSEVTAGLAGEAFALAVGATMELEDVRRIQYLRKIAPGALARLRESAARAATGYSLVSWS